MLERIKVLVIKQQHKMLVSSEIKQVTKGRVEKEKREISLGTGVHDTP